MDSVIRDKSLAPSGRQKIEWVKRNMPILRKIEDEFKQKSPFDGIKISMSIHISRARNRRFFGRMGTCYENPFGKISCHST
jgi:S-adenosylhomocysteine hydrolase